MEARPSPKPPRLWVTLQPTIVKIYKVAGLVALTGILVGLVGFLVVNVFYFFDHSWVRPVVLSPSHHKVVEASTQLADAKLRASELDAERVDLERQLAEIDRTVQAHDKLLAEIGPAADKPATAPDWLLRREVERMVLEKANATGRRAPLEQRLASLKLRAGEQEAVVRRLEAAPYLRAVNNKIVLAFVPYQNLRNVKLGTKLYGCAWGLVACRNVGRVTAVIDGEVTDGHPHDQSVQRGVMIELDVSSAAAGESVLFAGGKPLWLF